MLLKYPCKLIIEQPSIIIMICCCLRTTGTEKNFHNHDCTWFATVHVYALIHACCIIICQIKMFGAMHFIYYINRSIATKVVSTYLGNK